MTALSLNSCQAIVANALFNKYPGLNRATIDEIISRIWGSVVVASSETNLLALLSPIKQFNDDITNQVVVLQLIERFWALEPGMEHPLRRIHAALFGAIEQDQFRRSEFVQDYGGVVGTPVSEITARLDELERLCSSSIVSFAPAPLDLKAFFLAYIFSAIIRVHPFSDGNGRTARMFVQYALRSWRLPAIELPKVRNDAAWKQALANALEGKMSDLQAQFLQRMSNRTLDRTHECASLGKQNGNNE